ncbi:MAG: hypothetical protein M0Q88_02890 [Bacilli bacterium]|nr:hypothetical protein [Bacilli bacterium]
MIKVGGNTVDLQDYVESIVQRWKEMVDAKLGWDIYDEVEIEKPIDLSSKNKEAHIYHKGIKWASVYPSKDEEIDFKIYIIKPAKLKAISNSTYPLQDLATQLVLLIISTYIVGLEVKIYMEWERISREVN